MLENYKELIQKLFDNVFHNGNVPISFSQYVLIIGMSLLLIITGIFVLTIIVGVFLFPFWLYKKIPLKEKKFINDELQKKKDIKNMTLDFNKIAKWEHKIKIKKIIIITCLTLFYTPIAIPTILYIIDIFKYII